MNNVASYDIYFFTNPTYYTVWYLFTIFSGMLSLKKKTIYPNTAFNLRVAGYLNGDLRKLAVNTVPIICRFFVMPGLAYY